jgi:DNA (cytosine-5)-methyltransferase 1
MSNINTIDKRIQHRVTQIEEMIKPLIITDKSLSNSLLSEAIIPYFQKSLESKIVAHDTNENKYPFIDLFAGAGGLSLGLEQKGFDPITIVDNYLAANKTYLFNRPFLDSSKLLSQDIKAVTVKDFDQVPLIVGGPPCQGFSNANKQKKEGDERNQLYKFFVNSVQSVKPKIFLMENVEGILKFQEIIKDDFKKIGYSCQVFRFNTNDLGLPQQRKRVFFLGIDDNLSSLHKELFNLFNLSEFKTQPFSLENAIGDLPILEAKTLRNSTNIESKKWGYTIGDIHTNNQNYSLILNGKENFKFPLLNHKSKFNNDRDIEIYSLLKQGEKSDAKSIQHINPYKNRDQIFKDKFSKLVYSQPSKTITAHMYYDCHMYIHPTQARGLTPREAARIQGFPDDYLFLGSPNEWYRQIGNAVSPILARFIGEKLSIILDRIYIG